jgi:predicted Zn-dependent protease
MSEFAGFFSDGKTAEQRRVRIALGMSGLSIRDERGGAIADWPYPMLRLIEEVYAGQPVRLRSTMAGDARLIVREGRFLDALGQHARHLRTHNMRRSRALPRALIWSTATVGTLVGIYFGLPLAAEPVASIVPLSWEERLGEAVRSQAMTMFAGTAKACTAPEGRRALERLAGRLSGAVPSRYTFRIEVVDHGLVNAFAAPGGYIVIFRGLIDKAESAEEVAGVLGHEMGHVIERHGTEAMIREIGTQILLSAMIGDASGLASVASQVASLSYSRANEREADRIGVAMLNTLDIRAAGLAGFFRRLGKDETGTDRRVMRYFSTHPLSDERARSIESSASGRGQAMSAAEWQALRSICSIKR